MTATPFINFLDTLIQISQLIIIILVMNIGHIDIRHIDIRYIHIRNINIRQINIIVAIILLKPNLIDLIFQ